MSDSSHDYAAIELQSITIPVDTVPNPAVNSAANSAVNYAANYAANSILPYLNRQLPTSELPAGLFSIYNILCI